MGAKNQISHPSSVQFSHSVMSDSATPWTVARQASLSITNSQSLLKLISIKSVMPSKHLILCHPLLLQPSVFPSISLPSKRIPNNLSICFPEGGHPSLPLGVLCIVTSFQTVRCEKGGGKAQFTGEKPDKHCLSQVTKTPINSDNPSFFFFEV